MRLKELAVLPCLIVASGCAGVSVTGGGEDTGGFLTYTPVPHLLVERSKEGVVTTRVISLPDTSRPRYIKHHGGYGSLQFQFATENGMLTTFGQTSDSKVPETIASLAGVGALASGAGALHTAIATYGADGSKKAAGTMGLLNALERNTAKSLNGVNAYKLKSITAAIAKTGDAQSALTPHAGNHTEALSLIKSQVTELQNLESLEIPPKDAAGNPTDPVAAINKHFEPLPKVIKKLTEAHAIIRAVIDGSAAKPFDTTPELNAAFALSGAIGMLSQLVPDESSVELYRIDTSSKGVMYFTRVPLPFDPSK